LAPQLLRRIFFFPERSSMQHLCSAEKKMHHGKKVGYRLAAGYPWYHYSSRGTKELGMQK